MAKPLQGFTNVPIEIDLGRSDTEPAAVFTGPQGQEWQVPAFITGSGTWRVRFAASDPGMYRYRLGDDSQSIGTIEIRPYTGKNPLYRHGRLRVAASGRTLEHSDGTPFLWLGDTWWTGLTMRLDWPAGFAALARDRAEKGFNVIQIVAGPQPEYDADIAPFHPQQANEAGWSWEHGWTKINPWFYDLADQKILHLVEAGLVPCIVGMWGYYLLAMGFEKVKQHWRNLVARYRAYPVVWCAAGEVTMSTYSHKRTDRAKEERRTLSERWTDVMRYIREIDPYRNILTVHPGGGLSAREAILDESIVDLDMLQTGHGGYWSLQFTVKKEQEAVARKPRKPVVNAEVCYENIMGGSQQEVQRFLFWTSLTSGTAGHTYGAQGIWDMNSRDRPFESTNPIWGDGFWQDAMHLPGSRQVGVGKALLERYPWWLFEPRQEREVEKAKRISAFATGIPKTVWVFYLAARCMESKFFGVQGLRIPIEPGARYRAVFLDPRTGAQIDFGRLYPKVDGMWAVPEKPTMSDWVLVLQDDGALSKLQSR